MRDYARQCQDLYDFREKAAEKRQERVEQSAELIIQNDLHEVLAELAYTLEPDEIRNIPIFLRKDKAALGHLMASAIQRTALSIAEIGED